MTFRFQKRIPIISRIIWLNVGKKSWSISVGLRGLFSLNMGTRGVMVTFNMPISGLSYRKQLIGRSGDEQLTKRKETL